MSTVRRLNFENEPANPQQREIVIRGVAKMSKLRKNAEVIGRRWSSLPAENVAGRAELVRKLEKIDMEVQKIREKILEQPPNRYYNVIRREVASRRLRRAARQRATRPSGFIHARGLAREKERAMKNFEEFTKNFRKLSPVKSPYIKSPSPVRTKSPKSPNRLKADRIRLGIAGQPKAPGSLMNNRITWVRTPSGRVSITRTIENLNLKLTNAQKNRILTLPENRAKEVLRGLARM